MLRNLLFLCVVLLGLSPRFAYAEIEKTISSSRVLLGDLVLDAPADIADLDLGPAPSAGASRLYSAADLLAAAQQVGRKIVVTDSVRVVRATKRWSQAEFLAFVTPKLKSMLPEYAKLLRIEVPRGLVTVPSIELKRLELGQVPNRRGTVHTTAMVELSIDGRIEQRLSLPIVLDLDERPKPVEVDRGTSVVLVINLGSAKVSATAITLQSTAVGSVALFRVLKTRKTLRARLLTTSTAEVVSE
jgi:hypothetical protein